jgi:hypothetical protein
MHHDPADSLDPYRRLRPPGPTPADELCHCTDQPPVKLMHALGPNPFSCMRCHGEVLPEALRLPAGLTDPVADWVRVYGALDLLWLDSGAYETWAAGELANLESSANRAGLALRARIDPVRRCYYWIFDATSEESAPSDAETTRRCPKCSARMTPYLGGRIPQVVCEACSLVASAAEGSAARGA